MKYKDIEEWTDSDLIHVKISDFIKKLKELEAENPGGYISLENVDKGGYKCIHFCNGTREAVLRYFIINE